MGTQRHIMIALVLLSILTSLVAGAPLSAANRGLLPSPDVNVTTAHILPDVASLRPPISEYLTSFWRAMSTMRRSARVVHDAVIRHEGSHSPPPPPPPTQIAQTVTLRSTRLLHYEGMYKLVVEAGWGISIGIYDETGPGWKHGVNTTSSASSSCNENWCGIKVLFQASVPSHLSHQAESLSASAFCSGVASAKEAIAPGSSIALFNETDVTVPITTVHGREVSFDWNVLWIIALWVLGIMCALLICLCCCGGCGSHGV